MDMGGLQTAFLLILAGGLALTALANVIAAIAGVWAAAGLALRRARRSIQNAAILGFAVTLVSGYMILQPGYAHELEYADEWALVACPAGWMVSFGIAFRMAQSAARIAPAHRVRLRTPWVRSSLPVS
jgi:hypothetical protein